MTFDYKQNSVLVSLLTFISVKTKIFEFKNMKAKMFSYKQPSFYMLLLELEL